MKEFNGVIGYKGIKKELELLCDVLKYPGKYTRFGVEMPRGLLLHGEPGLGKTTMAKCFTEALGWTVFLCRKNKSDGYFIDEIKRIYEEAKKTSPAVVFLDDLDKFANDDEKHINSEEFVTVQSCIDDVRGKNVFTLATANDITNFPKSLLRVGRFDKIFEIEAPHGKDAADIIAYYLSKKNFVGTVDTKAIAAILDGCSCAELETVINEAGICAGFDGREKIEMNDIVRACLHIIFHAPEDISQYSPAAQKRIAYHEAGHAVVSEILEEGSINLISVCTHSGRKGGVASSSTSPDYFTSMSYMENRVITLLGGRAATEMVFGEIDTGASNDLKRAFDIVERLVDNNACRGFAQHETSDSGNNLIEHKNDAVIFEMERYYLRAKQIIADNRAFLDSLAAALVERKTLLGEEVRKIKAAAKQGA